MNKKIWIIVVAVLIIVLGIGIYLILQKSQPPASKPLNFAAYLHLEAELKFPNEKTYNQVNAQLKEIIDLFDKYDAKITIESAMPYAEAANKWGNDMLNYALDKGMGVGTHCDFSTTNTPNPTVTSEDFENLKEKVDAIVGTSNNIGCSGGFGAENWVQAAHDGGFSYLDAPVMNVYLRIPEENRPINPETNKPYTDEEIEKVYYHDPAPPDIRDRIYPRMLKDVQDLEEDKDGILLLMTGGLGEISSLYEGRKNCFPNCKLTQEDIDYIFENIDNVNNFKDNSRVSVLDTHFPLKTLSVPPEKKEEKLKIVEGWLKKMQEYQQQGKIKWVTMKEVYEEYIRNK